MEITLLLVESAQTAESCSSDQCRAYVHHSTHTHIYMMDVYTPLYTHTYTHTYICIYVYIHMMGVVNTEEVRLWYESM